MYMCSKYNHIYLRGEDKFTSPFIISSFSFTFLRYLETCWGLNYFFFPSRYDSSTIFKEGFLQTCLLIISKRKSIISSVQRRMYLKHRWAKWPLRVQAWWQWVDCSFSLLAHKPLHSSVFTCSLCLVPCDTLSLNGSCRLAQSFLIL